MAVEEYVAACSPLAPGWRWVAPANLHLTLRFCGGLAPDVLARVEEGLASVPGRAFELGLGGVGSFGRGRRARVLWLGVEAGAGALARLAGEVDQVCVAAGVAPEPRPFEPHLTLARAVPPGGAAVPELPPAPALPPFEAGGFALYRGRLRPGGAEYSILRPYPLKAL